MNNDIYSHSGYRLNKLFMRLIGVWPEQSRKVRIFVPIFFVVAVGSISIPELVRISEASGRFEEIVESLPILLVVIIAWIKLINTMIKWKAFEELGDRIKRDWGFFSSSPSAIEIFEKYAEGGRKLTIAYAVMFYGAATAFVGLPVIPLLLNVIAPLNESRPRKFMFASNYKVDPEEYYYYILFHSYLVTYTCMMIYVAADTMLAVWVQHCCALFEITGYHLRQALVTPNTFTSQMYGGDEAVYENLRSCIQQHENAMMYANLIESTYSTSSAGTTGSNMLAMSITGVLLVIKMQDTDEAIRYAALTLGQIFHLYYSSTAGQKILDHSNRISDYAYECDWCSFSPRSQKLLPLIVARAQKACLLTAGKVYVINMESFSAVIKTSISYFTVLSSLR